MHCEHCEVEKRLNARNEEEARSHLQRLARDGVLSRGSPLHLLAHHGLELGGHDDVRSGQELPRLALTLPQRIDSPLRELHGHKQLQVFIDDLIETVAALEVQQLHGSDAPRIRCCWAYSVMRREGGAR